MQGINLGDKRLNRRAQAALSRLGKHPTQSIPCGSAEWADTKATYNFFKNEKVTGAKVLKPHQDRTWERVASHPVVLAVQDTTFLDYTHAPSIEGLGSIGTKTQKLRGIVMHNTLAVTPTGVPLGEIDQQLWVRPEVDQPTLKQQGQEKAKKTVRPIEEKESYKWIRSMVKMQACKPDETQVVMVGDAESDVYELLVAAQTCDTAFLIRAAQDRALLEPETKLIRTTVLQTDVKATMQIDVAAKKNEPARTAQVAVRYRCVKLKPPSRPNGDNFCPLPLPPVTVYAVSVHETNPPAGMTPVDWLLLTNVPVETVADALERIEWYCQRWQVEVFHKILKSGCQIEQRRLGHFDRLAPCIALFTIIAWRIHWMTWLFRAQPNDPCTNIMADSEWRALHALATRSTQEPSDVPSVKQVLLWIAQLGGFLNRKSDGLPGVTVIWRGWQRFQDAFAMWLVFNPPDLTYG